MSLRAVPIGVALGSTGSSGREVSATTKVGAVQGAEPAGLTLVPGGRTGASARPLAAYAVVPKYVRKCPRSAWTEYAPYHLLLWPRGKPGDATVVEATCRSWRCEGECRRHQASVTYARILEALEPHRSSDVVFAVLTLDRDGTYSGEKWADTDTAYRELGRLSRNLLKRLNRLFDGDVQSRWVGVVEQHRTGWPHANLIIVCPRLASMLRAARAEVYRRTRNPTDWCRRHMHEGKPADEKCAGCAARLRELALVRGELLAHVVGAGWGPQSTMEVARNRGAVANYIVKTAGLQDEPATPESRAKGARITGEVAKLSQIPMAAPKGFRRMRSGVGFLPPRRKRDEYTGAMLDDGRLVKTPCIRHSRQAERLFGRLRKAPEHKRREITRAYFASVDALERGRMVRLIELAIALESTGQERQPWVAYLIELAGGVDLLDRGLGPP